MRSIDQLKQEVGLRPTKAAHFVEGLPVVGFLQGAGMTLVARRPNGEEQLFSPLRLKDREEVRTVLGYCHY